MSPDSSSNRMAYITATMALAGALVGSVPIAIVSIKTTDRTIAAQRQQSEQGLLREQRQKAYANYLNVKQELERTFDNLIAFSPNSIPTIPFPQELLDAMHKADDAEGDAYTQVLLLAPSNIRGTAWSLTNYFGLRKQGYDRLQETLLAHPVDKNELMRSENYLGTLQVVFDPLGKNRKEVDSYDASNQLIDEMSKDLGNV